MSNYLYWNDEVEIIIYPNGINLINVKNFLPKELLTKRNTQRYQLNDTALQIMILIDGSRSYEDIIYALSTKYEEAYEVIDKKVKVFLEGMKLSYNLFPVEQDISNVKNIIIKSRNELYPIVATIETTNKCNLKCRHCYGGYEKTNLDIMPLDKMKKLLRDLKGIQVKMIELTGGEATIHPNIEEIVQYAIDLGFEGITILSNGVSISKNLLNILINNKSKTVIQIDLHSLDEDYTTWFTGVPNIITAVKKNIEILAKSNVRMRVITIVTKCNFHEVEKIADYIHSLGTFKYAVSLVIPMGRAMDDKNLFLDESELVIFEKKMNTINKKYDGFLSVIQDGAHESKNCGCFTSNVVISTLGDIKICTMCSLDEVDFNFGNVFKEDLKGIYARQNLLINKFFDTKAPKFFLDECKQCENVAFCHGCILRGLIKAKQIGTKCKWFEECICDELKRNLIF